MVRPTVTRARRQTFPFLRQAALGLVLLLFTACQVSESLEPMPPLAAAAEASEGARDLLRETTSRLGSVAGDTSKAAARVHGEAGMALHALGHLDEAAVCYRNASRLAPREAQWPYYLGQLALLQDRPNDAAVHFGRSAELEPHRGLNYLMTGRGHALAGARAEAEAAFTRAIELEPSLALAWVWRGDLAMEQRRFDAAAEAFRTALELQPQANSLHVRLAQALRARGEVSAANASLAQRGQGLVQLTDPRLEAISRLAVDSSNVMQRGALAFERQDYPTAVAAFSEAVELEPGNATAHLNLGAALTRLGDGPGAEREFRRALTLDPGSARAAFNLGSLLSAGGETTKALEQFDLALELDPDYRVARQARGETRMRLTDYAGAAEDFSRLVNTAPGEVLFYQRLAAALALGGDLEAAVEAVQAGLDRHPVAPVLTTARARIAAVRNPGNEALGLMEPLVATSTSIGTVEALAMAYAAAGRYAEATSWQRRGIEALRASGRQDLLGEFERNLDRYERGLRASRPWSEKSWLL